MSLLVTVKRSAGDNPGNEIVLEYFASVPFAQEVGRIAIDRATAGMKIVSGVIPFPHGFVRPGEVIQHIDMRQGDCRAKVIDFSGQISIGNDGKPTVSIGINMRRKTKE